MNNQIKFNQAGVGSYNELSNESLTRSTDHKRTDMVER